VTVSVKSPAGLQFSVVGKVRNPGTFTPGRYVNALEALSFAGGPTEFAQLGGIIIVRKVGSRLEALRVRLSDTLKGSPGDLSAATIPQIQGGDTVVVP
jgi:polysaccharide export outer membrane protein